MHSGDTLFQIRFVLVVSFSVRQAGREVWVADKMVPLKPRGSVEAHRR